MIDIECLRVNYHKDWLRKSDGYTIPGFPCDGAVRAINSLCDEVERLRKRIKKTKPAKGAA